MPDIFISYSLKDAEQTAMLAEILFPAGLSWWINKQGIGRTGLASSAEPSIRAYSF